MNEFSGHAFLVAGDSGSLSAIYRILEKDGIPILGNPDVHVREYKSFGIDEARELRSRAATKALSGRRVFIVIAPSMTVDAQNALLKTLEEPPLGTSFIFVIHAPASLLPTLRSRAQVLTAETDRKHAIDAKRFIKASTNDRLSMLKDLLEKDTEDERNMAGILVFLAELERLAGEELPKKAGALEAIYRARRYATDKGALLKPLLESVALLV